jgi:hypothetical protein
VKWKEEMTSGCRPLASVFGGGHDSDSDGGVFTLFYDRCGLRF